MALIRATCRECGDIELQPRDLTLMTCTDNSRIQYRFRCPVCRMVELKDCDDATADTLIGIGVKCIEWSLPIELRERLSIVGKPVTDDDCIDFHELLNNTNWFVELCKLVDLADLADEDKKI